MPDVVDYVEPDLREQAQLLLIVLDDGHEGAQHERRHDRRQIGRHLPVLRVEESAQVQSTVLRVDVLLDEVLHHQRLLGVLGYLPQLPAHLEQPDNLADMVSLVVIAPVLLGYYEREGFLDALDADPEIQERHVEVEELFEALVHTVM